MISIRLLSYPSAIAFNFQAPASYPSKSAIRSSTAWLGDVHTGGRNCVEGAISVDRRQ